MVEGISPVANLFQDYTGRPAPSEKDAIVIDQGMAPKVKSAEAEAKDNSPSAGEVDKNQAKQAVDKMNKTMETYNTEIRFQLHEKSGEYMVKLINTKDNSVIREIPPEKVLNMVAYFKELVGIVIDKFA